MIQNFGRALTAAMPLAVASLAASAGHAAEVRYKDPERGTESPHSGGYVIELEDGYKIHHAGDTGVFGDMKLIGESRKF